MCAPLQSWLNFLTHTHPKIHCLSSELFPVSLFLSHKLCCFPRSFLRVRCAAVKVPPRSLVEEAAFTQMFRCCHCDPAFAAAKACVVLFNCAPLVQTLFFTAVCNSGHLRVRQHGFCSPPPCTAWPQGKSLPSSCILSHFVFLLSGSLSFRPSLSAFRPVNEPWDSYRCSEWKWRRAVAVCTGSGFMTEREEKRHLSGGWHFSGSGEMPVFLSDSYVAFLDRHLSGNWAK